MNARTARVLAFPVATALVASLAGCDGISPNDPSVRLCHDDTTAIVTRFPDGSVVRNTMIQHDAGHCRKAA